MNNETVGEPGLCVGKVVAVIVWTEAKAVLNEKRRRKYKQENIVGKLRP